VDGECNIKHYSRKGPEMFRRLVELGKRVSASIVKHETPYHSNPVETPADAGEKSTPMTVSAITNPKEATAEPKESVGQKIENFFSKFARVAQNVENAAVNIEVNNQAVLSKYLPASVADPINAAFDRAASTFAAMVATEQKIGGEPIPYAEKVALIVAIQGQQIAGDLAAAGVSIASDTLTTVVSAATAIGTLNLTNVTAVPTAPAPTPAA
jgi:hypothetical protein